jgi:hypothetical protein
MMERRAYSFPRKKRRFLVQFSLKGNPCSGFSHNLSASGIFVQSVRLPDPGTNLTLTVHLPDGKPFMVFCRVVRTHRVPGTLSAVMPSGFAVRITNAPEDYFQLVATL